MRSGTATLPIYGFTIFLGAALLFLLQLVFARLALPLLGGAPAVWNTAMVFYQTVLLAGYAYAHWIGRHAGSRRSLAIHAMVMFLPLGLLPFGVPASWGVPTEGTPVLWLLGLLAVSVGAPFFAVSTTAPLLQRWFASTGHPAARDPYFLYAASNTGSLAGLLAYPFLIEPYSSIADQSAAWAWGFGGLGVLCAVCGLFVPRDAGVPTAVIAEEEAAPTKSQRFRWVILAAVPCSLMLSITTYISSEIAAVPLLWVIPLALYLVTFILAFAKRRWSGERAARVLVPFLVAVVMVMAMGATTPIPLLVILHLVCFFLAALACHVRLAANRPSARRLTEFYFWTSVGGVIGGAFNTLLAPLIFRSAAEYPLMLVAAAWLEMPARRSSRPGLLLGLLPGIWATLAMRWLPENGQQAGLRQLLVFGVPALACFVMSRDRGRFTVAIAGLLAVAHFLSASGMRTLHATRSFFGIHRVTTDAKGEFRYLFHGKTVHGIQSLDPEGGKVPLGYYHPAGPLGEIFASRGGGPVAAVGLGAGAVAAYGKPGQKFVFYEIDPAVKSIASDPRYFSYLSRSQADMAIVTGDARLKLGAAPEGHYDLIVLDAYGSDSVPVHLLTREAMELYLRKLAPGGLVAFHVSNLHIDLRPVVAALAADTGLVCLFREDADFPEEEQAKGRWPSRWAVVARGRADLEPLLRAGDWEKLEPDLRLPVWTDDHSSILPLLDLRLR
jgi:spermidine synthase